MTAYGISDTVLHMFPYFCIFTILSALVYPYQRADEKCKNIIRWLCANVFIVFFGLRGSLGDDYACYHQYYNNVDTYNLFFYAPGYGVLNLLCNYFNLPFQCFLSFLSLITNGLLAFFLWDKKINFPFAFLVFFCLGGIVNEVDFIRNIISILLFAYSITYIEKKEIKIFLLLNFIGLLFHYSALLYIPMYWLFQNSMSKTYYAGIMCLCFFFSFFQLPWLGFIPMCLDLIDLSYAEHIQKYFTLFEGQKLFFSFGTIERVLTGFAVFSYYDKLMSEKYGRIIVNSYLLYFIFYEVFSNYAVLATRLANLFVFCYWLLWPLIIGYQSTRKRQIIVASAMCFYMTCRIIGLSTLPQWKYYTFIN